MAAHTKKTKAKSKPLPMKAMQAQKAAPKTVLKRAADVLILVAVVGTVGFAIYDRQKQASLESDVCRAPGVTHQLTLQNDAFSVKELQVNLCDVLMITNKDDLAYQLNFGEYKEHYPYAGYKSLVQNQNETISIDMFEKGTFKLHDHIRDKAELSLTVLPKK